MGHVYNDKVTNGGVPHTKQSKSRFATRRGATPPMGRSLRDPSLQPGEGRCATLLSAQTALKKGTTSLRSVVKKYTEMGKEIRITWPDQSNAILSNFILTGLHAACIHAACTIVKIEYIRTEMILMSVLDAHTAHIIRMFCNHHLTGVHGFYHHEVQNVCHLSRLCVLVVIPKSK